MAALTTIRAASAPDDIVRVRTLMREYMDFLSNHPTGSAHFCIGGFAREMAALPAGYTTPGGLLLAILEDKPVGVIAIRPLTPTGPMATIHQAEGGGLALELKRLWVRPAGRGLGVGRRLVQAAVDHARSQSASAVYLDTVPAAMPEACRLYEFLGFEATERYNSNDLNGVAYLRLRLASTLESAEVQTSEIPRNSNGTLR